MHNYKLGLSKKVLNWYDNNRRDLPWRRENSKKKLEFYTLVSEFMLQQTQVKIVIPYFFKFIKRFPNIKKLSNARIGSILKHWEGLGYYSRAKNLHITSKIICKKYSGRMPKKVEDLKLLPGVGDYTASMIMAIVNNKPEIAFDGNVKRVFKRFFLLPEAENKENLNLMKSKSNYFKSEKRPGDLVQALIELGALICKSDKPKCFRCPINNFCLSKNNIFVKKNSKRRKKVNYVALCYHRNKKILVTTKNSLGFLKNMVTVPMIKKNEFHKKKFKKNFKFISSRVKHNISNSNLDIRVATSKKNIFLPEHFWIHKKNFKNYPIPVLTKKIFKAIKLNII